MVSWYIRSKYSEVEFKIWVSSLDNTDKLLVKLPVLRDAETSPKKDFINKDFSEPLSGSCGASVACLSLM